MKYTYATKLNGTDQTGIVDLENSSIVVICDEDTARFIIDTLNQRDELLEALKGSSRSLAKYNSDHAIDQYCKNYELIKKIEG